MAINVVGRNPAHVKRCSCKNCASELEYTINDTRTEVHTDYGGGRDQVRYIQCPVCNSKVFVSLY